MLVRFFGTKTFLRANADKPHKTSWSAASPLLPHHATVLPSPDPKKIKELENKRETAYLKMIRQSSPLLKQRLDGRPLYMLSMQSPKEVIARGGLMSFTHDRENATFGPDPRCVSLSLIPSGATVFPNFFYRENSYYSVYMFCFLGIRGDAFVLPHNGPWNMVSIPGALPLPLRGLLVARELKHVLSGNGYHYAVFGEPSVSLIKDSEILNASITHNKDAQQFIDNKAFSVNIPRLRKIINKERKEEEKYEVQGSSEEFESMVNNHYRMFGMPESTSSDTNNIDMRHYRRP